MKLSLGFLALQICCTSAWLYASVLIFSHSESQTRIFMSHVVGLALNGSVILLVLLFVILERQRIQREQEIGVRLE